MQSVDLSSQEASSGNRIDGLPLINRELSFLAFDERVLALASDVQVPLLERLRYLCISSSNLDEFFEIRVAGLKQKILGGLESAGIDGLSPCQEMEAIYRETHELVSQQYQILNDVLIPELAGQDIRFFKRESWDGAISEWIKSFFTSDIAPVLSPLGLDPAHPFPRLTNKSLNFIIDLRGVDAFGRDSGFALVRAPRSLELSDYQQKFAVYEMALFFYHPSFIRRLAHCSVVWIQSVSISLKSQETVIYMFLKKKLQTYVEPWKANWCSVILVRPFDWK